MKDHLRAPITAGVRNYARRLKRFGPVAKAKVLDPKVYLNAHARKAKP